MANVGVTCHDLELHDLDIRKGEISLFILYDHQLLFLDICCV